jgi:hypothetical protein
MRPRNKNKKPKIDSSARNNRGIIINPREKYRRIRRKKIDIDDCRYKKNKTL